MYIASLTHFCDTIDFYGGFYIEFFLRYLVLKSVDNNITYKKNITNIKGKLLKGEVNKDNE